MKISNKRLDAARQLKSRTVEKIEYLLDVLQCLVLISIKDEFCCVKLTNKREFMKSMLVRKQ